MPHQELLAMPNPRKLTHSRGTSWEITYRVDGQMARRRFATRAQAVDELAKARVDIARGQGLLPVDATISVADYAEQGLATLQLEVHDLMGSDAHACAIVHETAERDGKRLDGWATHVMQVADGRIARFWASTSDPDYLAFWR
jgi:hypothetical protein